MSENILAELYRRASAANEWVVRFANMKRDTETRIRALQQREMTLLFNAEFSHAGPERGVIRNALELAYIERDAAESERARLQQELNQINEDARPHTKYGTGIFLQGM